MEVWKAIKLAVEKGEKIRHKSWHKECYYFYNKKDDSWYHEENLCDYFHIYANGWEIYKEPKKVIKVKDAASIMKELVKTHEVNSFGNWINWNGKTSFTTVMWQYCEKKPNKKFSWEPEWLEEVEE